MKGLRLVLTLILLQVAFYTKANAETWYRTDRNAKTIAKESLKLESKMLKIKAMDEEKLDHVAKKDAINEQIVNAEIKLQESLEIILYWAYKSPNQKRYMKRVARNVSASQLKALQKILDTLKHHESWMTDEYAVDYIEKQAEKCAKNDVLLAQENIRRKTRNVAQK